MAAKDKKIRAESAGKRLIALSPRCSATKPDLAKKPCARCFRSDGPAFRQLTEAWPASVRDQARKLAAAAFGPKADEGA